MITVVAFIEKLNIWNNFLNSGPHGANWPQSTMCVVKLPVTGTVRAYRNKTITIQQSKKVKVHAEWLMLQDLGTDLQDLRTAKKIFVTVFLSYSPNINCSAAFISFRKKYPSVVFTIVVAALYRCLRYDCKYCKIDAITQELSYEDYSNTKGLYELMLRGITLKSFDFLLWLELHGLLKRLPYQVVDGKETYRPTDINETISRSNHGRNDSREVADFSVAEDLKYIKSGTFICLYTKHPIPESWNRLAADILSPVSTVSYFAY